MQSCYVSMRNQVSKVDAFFMYVILASVCITAVVKKFEFPSKKNKGRKTFSLL